MAKTTQFPEYFFVGMLRDAKWPRSIGLFKKRQVVDTKIVDGAITYIAKIGVILGAFRPELGCQLLADILRNRDWDEQPISDLFGPWIHDIESNADKYPWEVIGFRLSENPLSLKPEYVPWEVLSGRNLRTNICMVCVMGLVWGLLNELKAKMLLEKEVSEREAFMPMAMEYGIAEKGESNVSLEEFIIGCEDMLAMYQEEYGALIPLPHALANTPEIRERLTN